MSDGSRVRLDRWLWAARFFKTRALAAAAIGGGKVAVGGARAKRAKLLAVGDRLRIRRGPFEYRVVVRALSEHRGPPATAAALYVEDVEGSGCASGSPSSCAWPRRSGTRGRAGRPSGSAATSSGSGESDYRWLSAFSSCICPA